MLKSGVIRVVLNDTYYTLVVYLLYWQVVPNDI